jgi:hypothetical protein
MTNASSIAPTQAPRPAGTGATVTQLATRRRSEDVLSSISFVFGGVHYGTIDVTAPYTKGKPIVLYVVAQREGSGDAEFAGPVDCLITDDEALAAKLEAAR